MVNTTYGELLKNGPFTHVILVPETIVGDEIVPAKWVPKDPSLYYDSENEKITMDKSLQLILIESLDLVMYNNIVNCTSRKQIWECEGSAEVKDNEKQILVSQYVMAKANESITEVFERFNKLINDLHLYNKYYETKEVNFKFLLTLPDHLESKIYDIREGRDLTKITLQTLCGILKTYKLEIFHMRNMQSNRGKLTNVSSALIANEPRLKSEEIYEKEAEPQSAGDKEEAEEEEFYTPEELEDLENHSMAYIARKVFKYQYSRRTRHSNQGNIMSLPLTAHDQGLPIKVDTRLDLLTDQKSNATTAMILDTL